jgi:hypothetical protein
MRLMDWTRILFICLYLFLGLITILIGKFLPVKICLPNPIKWQVVETPKYLRACRLIFFAIGLFWIAFGIILLYLKLFLLQDLLSSITVQELGIMMPAIIAIIISAYSKKYLKRII